MRNFAKIGLLIAAVALISSCKRNNDSADAFGSFECQEFMLSSQANGQILDLAVENGSQIKAGQYLLSIDSSDLLLTRMQLNLKLDAFFRQYSNLDGKFKKLNDSLVAVESRIYAIAFNQGQKALKDSLEQQKRDIEKAIDKWQKDQSAPIAALASQAQQLYVQLRQTNSGISKCTMLSPVDGVVTACFLNQYELAGAGRPVLRIANLKEMTLKVYVSESELSALQIGQKCKVRIDDIDQEMKEYQGVLAWISAQSEFTPKIIQTKKERVNLVYAVKIRVKNDGSIKIGMPGEVTF